MHGLEGLAWGLGVAHHSHIESGLLELLGQIVFRHGTRGEDHVVAGKQPLLISLLRSGPTARSRRERPS